MEPRTNSTLEPSSSSKKITLLFLEGEIICQFLILPFSKDTKRQICSSTLIFNLSSDSSLCSCVKLKLLPILLSRHLMYTFRIELLQSKQIFTPNSHRRHVSTSFEIHFFVVRSLLDCNLKETWMPEVRCVCWQ